MFQRWLDTNNVSKFNLEKHLNKHDKYMKFAGCISLFSYSGEVINNLRTSTSS